MEMTNRCGLALANDGREPTWRSRGSESFLDLTFNSEESTKAVEEWEVLDEETLSDHRYISFGLGRVGRPEAETGRSVNRWRWNPRKLDLGVARDVILDRRNRDQLSPLTSDRLSRELEEACIKASRGKSPRRYDTRKPKYWWTPEIAAARRHCVQLHRQSYQRTVVQNAL